MQPVEKSRRSWLRPIGVFLALGPLAGIAAACAGSAVDGNPGPSTVVAAFAFILATVLGMIYLGTRTAVKE